MNDIELKNDVKAHDIIAIDRMASLITTHYKYKAEFVDKLVAEYDHQSALLAKAVEALEKIIGNNTKIVSGGFEITDDVRTALDALAEITKGD